MTIMSLFSEATHKFQVITERESASGSIIETLPFLLACQEIIPFFDTIGSVAFSPIKKDINGNIQRLMDKYKQNTEQYCTLQSIIEHEIDSNIHTSKYSCTIGLLWLKRALEFVYVFLDSVVNGEHDLVKCANIAYDKSLRIYHGWIVRGVFTLALRAAPYYEDFMNNLKKNKDLTDEQVLIDISNSMDPLRTNIDAINKYYINKSLNFDYTV